MMPVFQWERIVHGWISRVSAPVLTLLARANFLLADETVILLALPVLFWHSVPLALTVAVGLLITSTKVEEHLKRLANRGRPRDPQELGLPSGDCALVSVWSPALLGWWAVIPIVLVAWARIARSAHWPLDTVAGTALGLWLGAPALLLRG